MKLLIIFITLFQFHSLFAKSISEEEEDEEEKLTKNILSFNEDYLSDVKDEYSRILVEDRADEIAVKIGVLANYFRVFKQIVPWSYEEKGFEQIYPEPEFDFDSEIAQNCRKGLEICVDFILSQLNSTQPWIGQNTFDMDELALRTLINNQRIGMEISASQKWTGESFLKESLIDEFVGNPFECATESFCPDPCCLKVPEVVQTSPKYSKFCRMNRCSKKSTCTLKNYENDDFFNLRTNKWNISCGCEKPGLIYRPDIGQCVHHNPCNKKTLCRDMNQECVNVASGYKCVCQLGYFMSDSKKCEPIALASERIEYHGFAHSEPIDPGNDKNSSSNSFFSHISKALLIILIFNFIK